MKSKNKKEGIKMTNKKEGIKTTNKLENTIASAIACTEDLLAALCIIQDKLQDENCNKFDQLVTPLEELTKFVLEKREFLEEFYE